MRIRINATPENRNLSSGNLASEKIDRGPKFWTQKSDLFSVKQRAGALSRAIPFVAIQEFPDRLAEDAINFDSNQSRLFKNSRISVLDEQPTSQYPVSVKPKLSQNKEALF